MRRERKRRESAHERHERRDRRRHSWAYGPSEGWNPNAEPDDVRTSDSGRMEASPGAIG